MAVSLEQICRDEGIDTDIAEYFYQKKGIRTAGVFANWVKNENILDTVVAHFDAGFSLWPNTQRSKEIRLTGPEDRSLLKACLKTLAERAESTNALSMNLIQPNLCIITAAADLHDSLHKNKPPTCLTNSRWHNLLGKNHSYPDPTVRTAESVLARMDHEHTVSKAYTPVFLDELTKDRSLKFLKKKYQAEKAEARLNHLSGPHTKPLLNTIDSLYAIGWSMMLVQWGSQEDVNIFMEWFTQIAWKHCKNLDKVRGYWDLCSSTLATSLTGSTTELPQTFKEATMDIMTDRETLRCFFCPDSPGMNGERQAPYAKISDEPRSHATGNPDNDTRHKPKRSSENPSSSSTRPNKLKK